jgi:hypothetical protein
MVGTQSPHKPLCVHRVVILRLRGRRCKAAVVAVKQPSRTCSRCSSQAAVPPRPPPSPQVFDASLGLAVEKLKDGVTLEQLWSVL